MARIIEQLAYKITGDTSQFDKSIDGTDKKTTGLTGKLGSLGKLLTVGAVAVGIVAVGKKLFNMATDAAAAGDRVDKMSQKIGISRDAFQEWDFILSQSGASVDGLQMSVKTLSNAASEARDGTAEYKDEFDRLGISVTDTNGKMKTQEGLLNEVFAALSNMEDETQRTATASKLLGRSATELAPAMNQGADSIEAMRQKSHELGLVLKDELIDEAVKFTDNMDQLRRKGKALLTEAIAPLLDPMNTFIEYLLNGRQPAKDLAEVTDDLDIASRNYFDVVKQLDTPVNELTTAELANLEAKRELLKLDVITSLVALSNGWEDNTTTVEKNTRKIKDATIVQLPYVEAFEATAKAFGISNEGLLTYLNNNGTLTDDVLEQTEAFDKVGQQVSLYADEQNKINGYLAQNNEIETARNSTIATTKLLIDEEIISSEKLKFVTKELRDAITTETEAVEESETATETHAEKVRRLEQEFKKLDYTITSNRTLEGLTTRTKETIVAFDGLEPILENSIDLLKENGFEAKGYNTSLQLLDETLPPLTESQVAFANSLLTTTEIFEGLEPIQEASISLIKRMKDATDETIESTFNWGEALNATANTIGWIGRLQDAQADAQIANLDEEILGEEKYASEKRRIMRESAEAQKKTSIFEAIVGTASAIVQASPNLLLMALAGVSGALQLATINATPLPSYDVGSINIPETQTATVHKGEMILPASIANEARQSGVSISPSGGGGNVYLDGVEVGKIVMNHTNGGRLGTIEKRIVK